MLRDHFRPEGLDAMLRSSAAWGSGNRITVPSGLFVVLHDNFAGRHRVSLDLPVGDQVEPLLMLTGKSAGPARQPR